MPERLAYLSMTMETMDQPFCLNFKLVVVVFTKSSASEDDLLRESPTTRSWTCCWPYCLACMYSTLTDPLGNASFFCIWAFLHIWSSWVHAKGAAVKKERWKLAKDDKLPIPSSNRRIHTSPPDPAGTAPSADTVHPVFMLSHSVPPILWSSASPCILQPAPAQCPSHALPSSSSKLLQMGASALPQIPHHRSRGIIKNRCTSSRSLQLSSEWVAIVESACFLSLPQFRLVASDNCISLRSLWSPLLPSQHSPFFSPQPCLSALRSRLSHKSSLYTQCFVDTLSNAYLPFGCYCRLARGLHPIGLLQSSRSTLHLWPDGASEPPACHQAILRICKAPSLYRIAAPRCRPCSLSSN